MGRHLSGMQHFTAGLAPVSSTPRHSALPQDERTRQKNMDGACNTCDLAMAIFLGILVLGVVAHQAYLDHVRGPNWGECDGIANEHLSKHLHCVSQNHTGTFAQFLAEQGAKKEHPYYAAERERLKHHGSTDSGRRASGREGSAKHDSDGQWLDPRVSMEDSSSSRSGRSLLASTTSSRLARVERRLRRVRGE